MVEFIAWLISPFLIGGTIAIIVYVRYRARRKQEIENEEDKKKWSLKTRKNVAVGIFSGIGLTAVIVVVVGLIVLAVLGSVLIGIFEFFGMSI